MLTIQDDKGVILAYLNNLQDAVVREVINGEYILTFIALIEPLKTEYLYDNDNLINYNNDLFRVVEFKEIHNEDDMLLVEVTAEHISYDLIKNIMTDFYYTYKDALYVMNKCLEGTLFRCVYSDIDLKTDIQYEEECNSKQISIAIANNWRAELQYHRYDIRLLKQRGANRGVDFRFGKNTKSISRIRNFAEDTVAYEIDIVQGSELEELGYFELGDTVRVIDDALNIDVKIRIVEIEKNVLTGINSKVVLGNHIKDLRSSFSGLNEAKKLVEEVHNVVNQNKPNWDKIDKVVNENSQVIADKIAGTMNTANTTIQNLTGTITWKGNTIMIHDQSTEAQSNWAIEIGAGGFRIADSKHGDGSWNWSTMATGKGINASEINTGEINSVNIRGVQIIGTEIIGGLINGVSINGANITIGGGGSLTYKMEEGKRFSMYDSGTQVCSMDGYGAHNRDYYGIISGSSKTARQTFYGNGALINNGDTFIWDNDNQPISMRLGGSFLDVEGNIYANNMMSRSIAELEVKCMELEYQLAPLKVLKENNIAEEWNRRYQRGLCDESHLNRLANIGKLTKIEVKQILEGDI